MQILVKDFTALKTICKAMGKQPDWERDKMKNKQDIKGKYTLIITFIKHWKPQV